MNNSGWLHLKLLKPEIDVVSLIEWDRYMFGYLPHQLLEKSVRFSFFGFPIVDFIMAVPYSLHIPPRYRPHFLYLHLFVSFCFDILYMYFGPSLLFHGVQRIHVGDYSLRLWIVLESLRLLRCSLNLSVQLRPLGIWRTLGWFRPIITCKYGLFISCYLLLLTF